MSGRLAGLSDVIGGLEGAASGPETHDLAESMRLDGMASARLGLLIVTITLSA